MNANKRKSGLEWNDLDFMKVTSVVIVTMPPCENFPPNIFVHPRDEIMQINNSKVAFMHFNASTVYNKRVYKKSVMRYISFLYCVSERFSYLPAPHGK